MSTPAGGRPEPENAWDQLPNESDKAYAAFRVYLELGPEERSLAKVAQHRAKTGQGKSPTTVKGWSSKHRWRARVEAFDAQAVRTQDETVFEELAARGREQARIAVDFLETLELPGQELARRLREDPEALKDVDIAELVKLAQGAARALPRVVQTERLARGQSTTNVGGHDGGPIETESRVAAEKWASEASDAELDAFLLGAETERQRLEAAGPDKTSDRKSQPKRKDKSKQ